MRTFKSILCSTCLLSFTLSPLTLADDLIISEIVSVNRATLTDQDGDFSDWVEIFNGRTEAVNLDGWHLTDDPQVQHKWAFPDVVLPPGGFLVVFASRKAGSTTEQELHTNFKIDGDGEFLGLVRPDDTMSSALPRFPRQIADTSYGFAMETVATEILAPGATARYLVPRRSRNLPSEWKDADFDDSAWAEGVTRFGFDRGDELILGELIETDVGELMHRQSSSLFMRIPLQIPDPLATISMRLRVRYNDGFVASINGVEIARRNATNTRYNSSADSERPIEEALTEEAVDLAIPPGTLRADRNLLAIQAMNFAASSTDFLFVPSVDVIKVTSVSSEAKYFATPSPAVPNTSPPFDGVSERPVLTPESTSFVDSLMLTIERESNQAVIRYTIDGTRPDETSPIYEQPFEIDQLSLVQARAFQPGRLPSEIVTETYLRVRQDLADTFSSNVPVVLLTTFGTTIGERLITPMHMQIVEGSDDDRATLTGGVRDFSGDGVIKTRGSSTSGRRKVSFGFEIQDEAGDDRDVSLLGMPAESDWILYGAYNFDRALLRNPFMYELSNQIGRYAVRCRFCEVFVHSNRSTEISPPNYMGVYSLCEKIKRGPDRVDIEPLLPTDNEEPDVSGGYILKIDRPDPGGDNGFNGGGESILFVDPKEREATAQQKNWIRKYFNQMAVALRNTRAEVDDIFDRPYVRFIDVDSWIDHNLLNEFSKNPDAFVLSTFFFKRRNGPVEFGPIWDFDRSLGPDDDARAATPTAWARTHATGWWGQLFRDPRFLERYRTRWVELRQGPMSTLNMHAIVDSMAAEIREAQVRNNNRWRLVTPEGWELEVQQLKTWIEQRGEWIDSQLISSPVLSHPGGRVSVGFEVTMSSPEDLEIYFTVDGSDPLGSDRSPSASAVLYETPLRIEQNTQVRLRAGSPGSSWSSLVEAFYVTSAPPFVITEIMYNPPRFEGDSFERTSYEFVEFQNVGDEPLDLTGYTWLQPRAGTQRVKFDFTEGGATTLAPGALIVVARRLEAFRQRYGDDLPVLGEIGSDLENAGERIRLVDGSGFPLTEFRYDDEWAASTDGAGKSLVIRNAHAAPETWALQESWRASTETGGSPGHVDPGSGGQLLADVNLDGRRSVTDAVGLLLAISGRSPFPCATPQANTRLLDTNRDGQIDVSDVVYLLDFLFRNGTPAVLDTHCQEIDGCQSACTN